MNPSYCRVHVSRAGAIDRFAAWQRLPSIGPLPPTDSVQAVRLACDERGMRQGHAVFVSAVGNWTRFSDLSGVLGGIPARRWHALAGPDELVFAGYNDAIRYGGFVLVRGSRVVREFLEDAQSPETNVNVGRSDVEGEPFATWVDVAGFVDTDEVGVSETGLLWVWR